MRATRARITLKVVIQMIRLLLKLISLKKPGTNNLSQPGIFQTDKIILRYHKVKPPNQCKKPPVFLSQTLAIWFQMRLSNSRSSPINLISQVLPIIKAIRKLCQIRQQQVSPTQPSRIWVKIVSNNKCHQVSLQTNYRLLRSRQLDKYLLKIPGEFHQLNQISSLTRIYSQYWHQIYAQNPKKMLERISKLEAQMQIKLLKPII